MEVIELTGCLPGVILDPVLATATFHMLYAQADEFASATSMPSDSAAATRLPFIVASLIESVLAKLGERQYSGPFSQNMRALRDASRRRFLIQLRGYLHGLSSVSTCVVCSTLYELLTVIGCSFSSPTCLPTIRLAPVGSTSSTTTTTGCGWPSLVLCSSGLERGPWPRPRLPWTTFTCTRLPRRRRLILS